MYSPQTIALAALVLCAAGPATPAELPPHPRLLLTKDGIDAMKQRIGTCEWAKQVWQGTKKRADALLAKRVELPPRGGNWTHWYVCPKHNARLVTGKQIGEWQWEHSCPVDKEAFKSDPADPSRDYDGCRISGIQHGWADGIRDLGLAYQVTGDARYASKAREIALAYAEVYLTYPLHTTKGKPDIGGGRVGAQTLDESTWLIPTCQGLDFVWDTLSESDRATIANKLILPAAKDVILAHKMGIHNIQCWKNSAVGLAGYLLDNHALVRAAIDNPERGYRAQMAKGVLPDGGWYEGAWGYHFYTMSAIWPLTEAARNCGTDLYGPGYRGMFEAPLKFAMPNLRLPAFSDSGETDVMGGRGLYELAYARYRDPAYAKVLSRSDRRNEHALFFGATELPAAPSDVHPSANYPSAGYAILTRGEGQNATWLCMKYGPYGGGHGHPDKLGFVLYSRGQVIAIDPGTVLYGSPTHLGWCKTSIAHNTLVVDEANQKAVDGKLIAFGQTNGVDYVVADAGPIYEGVRYIRTAALLDANLVVIIDQVTSDAERVLDLAYHQRGAWLDLPTGTVWDLPGKPGYKYLSDATTRPMPETQALATRVTDDWRVAVSIDPCGPAELITALGITSSSQDRVPVAIVRRKGLESTVVWAIGLDGKPAKIERLASMPISLRVTAGDGRSWELTTDPDSSSFACNAMPTK